MRYFRTVKAIAQALLLKGCASWGMSPVLGSTPRTSPVKSGMMQTQRAIMSTEYVQKYMHTCTHSGGLPLPLVNWVTRMRQAKKRIASIGAKLTVSVAVCKIFWMGKLSYFTPQASAIIRTMARQVYTIMNWIVRLMTHCMDVVTPLTWNCDPTMGTCLTALTFSIGSFSACRKDCWHCAAATIKAKSTAMVLILSVCSLA